MMERNTERPLDTMKSDKNPWGYTKEVKTTLAPTDEEIEVKFEEPAEEAALFSTPIHQGGNLVGQTIFVIHPTKYPGDSRSEANLVSKAYFLQQWRTEI